ncbi:DNA replication factor Dna2-domain-containing protein [Melampsora americana]|nr:DNA replication factor Dna2-domain-containing protein [Melampsora americana]
MNKSRQIPTKIQQDNFMEDLFEGLSPSDLIPSSPIEQKKLSKINVSEEIRNMKNDSQNDLLLSNSKSHKKSSPKGVLQSSGVKRQGSLMQCNSDYHDSKSINSTRSTHSPQRASDFSKGESYPQTIQRNTKKKETSHTRGISSSPLSTHKLAKSFSKLSPEKLTVSQDPITHVAHHHEDYEALFMDLEDGWDEFIEDEYPIPHPNPKVPLCQQYTKCIISDIITSPEWNPLNKRMERIIEVTINSIQYFNQTRQLLMCDEWSESLIELNDELNLISLPDSPPLQLDENLITFSRSEPGHLIILFPSLLINTTAVSTAPSCPRRGVLNDRIKSSHNDIGEAVIRGTIVHEVIQSLLLPSEDLMLENGYSQSSNSTQELWPMTKILKEARKACVRHVSDLLMINQTVDQGFRMVSDHLKELNSWSKKYILQNTQGKRFELQKDAHLFDPRSNVKQDEARPKISLTSIRDIEEEIWSPKYGLKGKIDATVEAAIIEEPMKVGFFSNRKEFVTQDCDVFPLEIKTGRKPNGVEHTAQTMLYTLLMSDRYNQHIPAGLLFYTSINEITRVRAVKAELRQLLIARNHLASYIHKRAIDPEAVPLTPTLSSAADESSPHFDGDLPALDIERTLLPEPIDDAQTCPRCYAVDSCMLYRKTFEGEDEIPSRRGLETLQSIYREKTEHITPNHSTFFTKWESLISLEERELGKFKKEIWELTAEKRQAKGRAFANMEIDEAFDDVRWLKTAKRSNTIHRLYLFQSPRKRRASGAQVVPTQSLLSGQMGVGDPVVISIEGEKLAIAKGFICDLSPYRIVIGLDHRLENIGAVPIGRMIPKSYKQDDQQQKISYRIDKDELMAGMGRIRDNIAQLFYIHGDHKRRELVVDLRTPVFEPTSDIVGTDPRFAHLNEDQRDAIYKVMCWLKDVLSDDRKVVFVDTDKIDAHESITGSLVQNKVEAQLVVQIVNALLRGGVPATEIGVITPYRQQIKLLNYLLEHAPTVEIITADKSQGRDKSCIVMTMVRNNETGNVGELLKDWRRINVCLTRSREKLIILGSYKTLKNSEILDEFLGLVERKKWIYELQSGDQFTHASLISSSSSSTSINLLTNPVLTPCKVSRIRDPSSPIEKVSPRLRRIRKTHAVLNEIHISFNL